MDKIVYNDIFNTYFRCSTHRASYPKGAKCPKCSKEVNYMKNHAIKFGDISTAIFYLSTKETTYLRGKYGNMVIDLPKTILTRMTRKQLIQSIMVQDFGSEAMEQYKNQVDEWNEDAKFVYS